MKTGVAAFIAALLLAPEAPARVLPTTPVTRYAVIPAVQKRAARHSVVLELVIYGASCEYCVQNLARVVVHDSLGVEKPRDVTPGGMPLADLVTAAAWEGDDGTLRLLLGGSIALSGRPSPSDVVYSGDGGATWNPVAVPAGSRLWASGVPLPWPDSGVPVASRVGPPIRLGTPKVPFVLSVWSLGASGIWGVRADGSAYSLTPPALSGMLLGSDVAGARFLALLHPAPSANPTQGPWTLSVLDLAGNRVAVFDTSQFPWVPWTEGWITRDGNVYLDVDWTWDGRYPSPPKSPILPSSRSLAFWDGNSIEEVVSTNAGDVLGVPTSDFSGAWVLKKDADATVLAFHSPSGGLVDAWRDESRPFITGIFVAGSGRRILFPRSEFAASASGSFGLAVWDVGQPPPASYDRVVLDASEPPTFVNLDVDAAATTGAPVFVDPGSPLDIAVPSGPPPPPTAPANFQTSPLVRLSLRQQLLIPAAARAPGRFGASWRTDLILRNPGASPLPVTVRLLPNPSTSTSAPDVSVTVGPRAISVVPDVLGSLFHLENGSGALLLLPGSGGTLEATSRSYTVSPKGTLGMAVDALDVVAAVRPGYSQAFSAGLLGTGFRTNVVSSDLSGEGSRLRLFPSVGGGAAVGTLSLESPPGGQTQLDEVAKLASAPGSESGSFLATSDSGAALTGVIVIDDATNDPTWSQPDAFPGPLTIPAVVHASGMNGARYRTDLFLFNPDAIARTVGMNAVLWDEPGTSHSATVTLAPGEWTRIPDALFSLFGLTGVARLSLWSGFPNGGVSTTSRTYALLPDGSTYGMGVPPLVASQVAGKGETSEILGPTGGASARPNLSLVMLGFSPGTVHVQILDENGTLLDELDQVVPAQGGVQVDDLFRTRGLGDGPKAALLRLSLSPESPLSGRFAAYATTIDDGTNDPVYFVGHLAIRE